MSVSLYSDLDEHQKRLIAGDVVFVVGQSQPENITILNDLARSNQDFYGGRENCRIVRISDGRCDNTDLVDYIDDDDDHRLDVDREVPRVIFIIDHVQKETLGKHISFHEVILNGRHFGACCLIGTFSLSEIPKRTRDSFDIGIYTGGCDEQQQKMLYNSSMFSWAYPTFSDFVEDVKKRNIGGHHNALVANKIPVETRVWAR